MLPNFIIQFLIYTLSMNCNGQCTQNTCEVTSKTKLEEPSSLVEQRCRNHSIIPSRERQQKLVAYCWKLDLTYVLYSVRMAILSVLVQNF